MILRAQVTKGEQIRYISHLDYARTMERALRRAKIPVAYSEGFNPHTKMAFASALAVGVTSEAEYMDVELSEEMEPEAFIRQLSFQLPAGIVARQARRITPQHKSLMAVVNYATYTVDLPLAEGSGSDAVLDSFRRYHAADVVLYTRQSPKGKREINQKEYVKEPIRASVAGTTVELAFGVHITPTGSVKPGEVIEKLADSFGLPVDPNHALVHRTGLWIKQLSLVTPLDI